MALSGTTSIHPKPRVPRGQRVFTLEHAHRTLPLVSRIMADVVKQNKKVCLLESQCEAPKPDTDPGELEAIRERYLDALDELSRLRNELSEIGCQLKDWRRGIVDFLAMHQGRLVELCWRLGEERIKHWHEVDAGFRGRQPINEDFLAV
ncbi:MAG: DUF2203 domain-containing protein [Phycisphaerae bacterium]